MTDYKTMQNEIEKARLLKELFDLHEFDDEHMEWMRKCSSMSVLQHLLVRVNPRIRFRYWFDVIKDVKVSTDVLHVLDISNVDYIPSDLSTTRKYQPGIFSNALHKLHESGNMNSSTLIKLKDICRLVYNIAHNTIEYYTLYNIKWFDYVIPLKRIRKSPISIKSHICALYRRPDYNELIQNIIDHNISIDTIIKDVDFINEYMQYIDCDKAVKIYIGYILEILNQVVKEYEIYNQTKLKSIKDEAKISEERILKYINSGTKLFPQKYWNAEFTEDLEYDKDMVKKYFPDTYQMYVKYVRGISDGVFTTRLHTLITMYNNLTDKFGDLYNISLLDYVLNGGVTNINDTLNFIYTSGIPNQEVRKLIGPLKKLSKYTKTYVSYDDEMSSVHIIKDHELTTDGKQKIFDFMKRNKYPQWLVLFNQIAKAYIEGTIEL